MIRPLDLQGYRVYRATQAQGPYDLIASLPPDQTTYTDTKLPFMMRVKVTQQLQGFSQTRQNQMTTRQQQRKSLMDNHCKEPSLSQEMWTFTSLMGKQVILSL